MLELLLGNTVIRKIELSMPDKVYPGQRVTVKATTTGIADAETVYWANDLQSGVLLTPSAGSGHPVNGVMNFDVTIDNYNTSGRAFSINAALSAGAALNGNTALASILRWVS